MLAAMFSIRVFDEPAALDWPTIVLLYLLVDPIWGMLWRLGAGRDALLPLHAGVVDANVWLPYLQQGSLAARLFDNQHEGIAAYLLRVALPSVVLAMALSLVIGPMAVGLTAIVIGASIVGWIGRVSYRVMPALLHSAVTIVLPWILSLYLFGVTTEHSNWFFYSTLALLWGLHQWGVVRYVRFTSDRLGTLLIAIADIGLAILLIAAKAPLWLALLSILWIPTWLSIYRGHALQRLSFWWLLAMLLSGVALGQSLPG